ncbi:MAG: hypothetical protein AVDCRST_MAG65-1841 [uncultured Solirubrobacteraceae bacterium]|uniref:Uncharacterized protein n=1 Tax=uncultured Solirubrobacteraceae bacterium TaxID=1162706 RepID=A0A6J4S8E4_9ACTN|nr:MAG: hypothetical protein AVDCRST_MAG65-1841 [uncultured Solirubrobacteraceae bacterium]
MGLLIASVAGLIFWIVAWSLGAKSIDAFLVTILVFLVAAAARVINQHRGRSRGDTA